MFLDPTKSEASFRIYVSPAPTSQDCYETFGENEALEFWEMKHLDFRHL